MLHRKECDTIQVYTFLGGNAIRVRKRFSFQAIDCVYKYCFIVNIVYTYSAQLLALRLAQSRADRAHEICITSR